MRATIKLVDLPEGGIGFSVTSEKQAKDSGVTDAGYLVHQPTQTLQHIAVETEFFGAPAKPAETVDRLIDLSEVTWLAWVSLGPYLTDFPQPIEKEPRRWSRQSVMDWVRSHYPRRIDLDLAQDFIRRPYLCHREELQ